MKRSMIGLAASAVVLGGTSLSVSAALVDNVGAFNSAVTSSAIENLEAYADGGTGGSGLGPPEGAPLSLNFGGIGGAAVTLKSTSTGGKTSAASSIDPTAFNGRHFGPDANTFWDAAGDDFYIEFTTSITAFGFDWADVGDFNGADDGAADPANGFPSFTNPLMVCLSNSATGGAGDLCEPIAGSGTDGARGFAGVYDSTPLSTSFTGYKFVRFVNQTGGFDGQAFDNFRAGMAGEVVIPPNRTPEPGSIALLGLGLLGLALRRKR